MKKMLLCLLLMAALMGLSTALAASNSVSIDASHFPDAVFRARVSEYDTDGDGKLSTAEAKKVKTLDVSGAGIADLTGVEYFTALRVLDCSSNQLTALDVHRNTALTELYCYANKLSRLDVRYNTALTLLDCQSNRLSDLDLRFNSALNTLFCDGNGITTLNISACPVLLQSVRDDLYVEDAVDGTANYYKAYDYSYFEYDIITGLSTRLSTRSPSYTVLSLPSAMTKIGAEAFRQSIANVVICPNGLVAIGKAAFADCAQLKEIHIPDSVTSISDNAFDGCDDLVIYTNSATIQAWAEAHDILWKTA